MKLKTLLLGSAAAFVVVGGAQAADLTIAEPVEYVRVCEAFGTGYWYIPGTTTCIKIGGEVAFDINFHKSEIVLHGTNEEAVWNQTNHSAGWTFATSAKLRLIGKSETDLGTLEGYIEFKGVSENAQQAYYPQTSYGWGPRYFDNDRLVKVDKAYLSLGPLLAGYTNSTFDPAGPHVGTAFVSDTKTDQIRLTWAMGGFGLMLAVEDPRDRWGTHLAGDDVSPPAWEYSMPDIIGAITMSQGNWDAKLSAGFAGPVFTYNNFPTSYQSTVWGVNGSLTFKADAMMPGAEFIINGAVGSGTSFVGGGTSGFTNASMFASLSLPFTSTLTTNVMGSVLWDGSPCGSSCDLWHVGAALVWGPVTDFSVEGRVEYEDSFSGGNGEWSGRIELKRTIDDP